LHLIVITIVARV